MALTNRLIALGLFCAFAALCFSAFTPMLQALHNHWTTTNDLDAGYLLLGFVLYLLWQVASPAVHDQAGSTDKPLRVAALLTFICVVAAASVAAITANKSATLGLLVVAFAPLYVWVLGARWLSNAAHASAILFMATPIWFVLVPQLQGLTAAAVNWLLSRGSWPIFIEGNLIALPQGLLEIAAGCAGLKFLQTALALTLIEGFLARRSWRAMALIGAGAIVLAVVSNWLRVSIITLLALKLDPGHPWVADHNWVGWLLFAVLFGPLFYWLGNVELFAGKTSAPPNAKNANTATPAAAGTGTPSNTVSITTTVLRAGLALGLAFGTAAWLSSAAEGAASARVGKAQVTAVREFCAQSARSPIASFPGAALVVDCVTASGRQLALRGYLREQQEQEVINPVNELIPGLGLLEYRVTSQPGANVATAPAIVRAPGANGQSRQIAYGFYATGAWSATSSRFKLRSLLRPFVPGPVYSLVVVDPPETASGPADAADLATEFSDIARSLARAGE